MSEYPPSALSAAAGSAPLQAALLPGAYAQPSQRLRQPLDWMVVGILVGGELLHAFAMYIMSSRYRSYSDDNWESSTNLFPGLAVLLVAVAVQCWVCAPLLVMSRRRYNNRPQQYVQLNALPGGGSSEHQPLLTIWSAFSVLFTLALFVVGIVLAHRLQIDADIPAGKFQSDRWIAVCTAAAAFVGAASSASALAVYVRWAKRSAQ